jgi:phage-related holin
VATFTEVSYLIPAFLLQLSLPSSITSYIKEDVQNAIAALRNSEYPLISRCATAFNIPRKTLSNRLQKIKTRIQSYEKQQILTFIEEEELAIWINNASKLGVPTPLPLVKILAKEIQSNRFTSRAESEKSY